MVEEDQKLFDELRELVNYVGGKFGNREVNTSELNLKQLYLLFTFAAVNNYTEAIYTLCKDFRPIACVPLMRSLVEAYINTAYLLSFPNQKKVFLFSTENSFYRKGLAEEMEKFVKKYPRFKPKNRIYSDEFLSEMKRISEEELERASKEIGKPIKTKEEFSKFFHTKLIRRAQEVDSRFGKGNFENMYLIVYKYFSEYSHLSVKGINNFLHESKGKKHLLAGQSNDLGHVLITTFAMYLFFAHKLKQYKLLPDLKLLKFQKRNPVPTVK